MATVTVRRSARIAAKTASPVVEVEVVPAVPMVPEWPTIDQARFCIEEYGIKSYPHMRDYAREMFRKMEDETRFNRRLLVLICTESMLKYRNELTRGDIGLIETLEQKLIDADYPDKEYLNQWRDAHNNLYPDMVQVLFGK